MNNKMARSGRDRPPGQNPAPRTGRTPRPSSKDRKNQSHGERRRPELGDHYVFGLHAAEFALRHPARDVHRIWATENAERKLADALALRQLDVIRVLPRDLDKRVGRDTVHQGVVLEVAPLVTHALADLAERALSSGQPIIALDQVTDPHNVGAVLRSCAVFGAAGLLMTRRHSPPLGGTLAKSASGALDLMPVCLVQNLAKALAELKDQSCSVIGLDGLPEHRLLEEGLAARGGQALVLALGAEGRGLRDLTLQSCDEVCRIGGDGPITSLNVSNAAAIALQLAAMQRRSMRE